MSVREQLARLAAETKQLSDLAAWSDSIGGGAGAVYDYQLSELAPVVERLAAERAKAAQWAADKHRTRELEAKVAAAAAAAQAEADARRNAPLYGGSVEAARAATNPAPAAPAQPAAPAFFPPLPGESNFAYMNRRFGTAAPAAPATPAAPTALNPSAYSM